MTDTQKTGVIDMLAQRRANAGFTLIEISIVLVLIGLMVGGLLVGADMIKQAALRKQATQIELIESGIQNFRTKYNCYPGDCVDPTIISGYTYTGNGDGFLEAVWNGDENKGFWLHMALSNMINYPLLPHPALVGMTAPVMTLNGNAYINAYGSATHAQNVLEFATPDVSGALEVLQISYIDSKADDGLPNSGSIRSSGYGNGATTIYDAPPTFPLSTANDSGSDKCISGAVYNTTVTNTTCNMIYVIGAN